ncbi:GvpL/GvpF family gas vesicle protein [Rhizohabitans arisaemae]|uniref:GvpL/GvpF family gas vesicle protein n=1 Tax=Rhizohabitans arisaemae TaxID=2720610 RepID=UPI0024B21619|nr:GvpL/GvpF family gas vesicle protein [Rhizohabitans arisaemae]
MTSQTAKPRHTAASTNQGCYVYGIVPADVEVEPGTPGVHGPSSEVGLVTHGEIGALVSEVPLDRPLGTPDSLTAHQRLLDEVAAEVPVLPMRFGAVMSSPQAVVQELLTPYHEEFRTALAELEGHAEYVVKGRYVERHLLEEVLEENPEARRLREEIRELPEDAGREARIELGELVNQAVAAKRDADTREIAERLVPLSVLVSPREPSHEQDAVHLALLVADDRRADLERTVDEFARRYRGRVDLWLLGPMAPYDFVVSSKPGDEEWD